MAEDGGKKDECLWTEAQESAIEMVNSILPKDFYAILDIEQNVSDRAIHKAYQKLALLCHPDKNKHPGASQATQRINNAYKVLKDSELRCEYDRSNKFETRLKRTSEPKPTATGNDAQSSKPEADHTPFSQLDTFWKFWHHSFWILFLIFFSFLYFDLVPQYSLQQTAIHIKPRYTTSMGVQYYTTKQFKPEPKRVFWTNYHVERTHFKDIRNECLVEHKFKRLQLTMATLNGNATQFADAMRLATDACIKVLQVIENIKEEYISLRKRACEIKLDFSASDWGFNLPCSMYVAGRFNQLRTTKSLTVQYYVDMYYDRSNRNNVPLIEVKVEESYLLDVINECRAELGVRYFVARLPLMYGLKVRVVSIHPEMFSCMELIELFPMLTNAYLKEVQLGTGRPKFR